MSPICILYAVCVDWIISNTQHTFNNLNKRIKLKVCSKVYHQLCFKCLCEYFIEIWDNFCITTMGIMYWPGFETMSISSKEWQYIFDMRTIVDYRLVIKILQIPTSVASFKTSHIFHFIGWLKFDYSFVLGNTILTSTRSTVDRTEEQSFMSTKSNLHEETNQNMIEINGRGKSNRRLFADNFLSTVLITFVGTAISCFLLFSIGSQIKSRLLIKMSQNSQHTPELHVCTHRI